MKTKHVVTLVVTLALALGAKARTQQGPTVQTAQPPKPVLGFWAGMSVKEFMKAVREGQPEKQKPKCPACLEIIAEKLPVTYRGFHSVIGEFYEGKLVYFQVIETVEAADDGSDVRGEANAIAGDLEDRYGKPNSTTRHCSEPGFTYATIGKFWTTALGEGNLDWTDSWDFTSASLAPVPPSPDHSAAQARLTSIYLGIDSATDEDGNPRANHATVSLAFAFRGFDKYEAAKKKARESVF